MSWDTVMPRMLRILINDYGDESTEQVYSDSRLEDVIMVAAMYTLQELDFTTASYTVTLCPASLSPDPTTNGDTAFVNLVVMKAACISDFSTFRSKALAAGIKAKCGPVALDTLKHLDGFKELLTVGPCATYEVLKDNFAFGNGNICRAILSPFVSNAFSTDSLNSLGKLDRAQFPNFLP